MCLIFDFTLYMRFIQPDASVLLLFYHSAGMSVVG